MSSSIPFGGLFQHFCCCINRPRIRIMWSFVHTRKTELLQASSKSMWKMTSWFQSRSGCCHAVTSRPFMFLGNHVLHDVLQLEVEIYCTNEHRLPLVLNLYSMFEAYLHLLSTHLARLSFLSVHFCSLRISRSCAIMRPSVWRCPILPDLISFWLRSCLFDQQSSLPMSFGWNRRYCCDKCYGCNTIRDWLPRFGIISTVLIFQEHGHKW